MRRGAVVLALVLVLSGCNGLGGSPDGTPTGTVTPAPVPTTVEDSGGDVTRSDCVAPPPATPDERRTAEPGTRLDSRRVSTAPATSDGSPTETGSRTPGTFASLRQGADVHARQLIKRNDAALQNHSYHLVADGDDIEARVLPDAAAFSYQGVYINRYVSVYVVNGVQYRVDLDRRGREALRQEPYEGGADGEVRPSRGASFWLASLVGAYEYTYAGTRTWNGTTVYVFRENFERPYYIRLREIVALDSTIYVDRRGIIRWIDHRERYRSALRDDGATEWRNESYLVTDVGTARIRRPSAFCGVVGEVPDPDPDPEPDE